MNRGEKEVIWKQRNGEIRPCPARGRVLGISIGGHDGLWSPETQDAPWNLGGERLWFGPEADWNWLRTDQVDFDNYRVPEALSPDQWRVTDQTGATCGCEIKLELHCASKPGYIVVEVKRRFDLVAPRNLPSDHEQIGYLTTTSIDVLGGTMGQEIDLWSLLQIPVGGYLLVPGLRRPVPRNYFEECPEREYSLSDRGMRLKIGGDTRFKIGLSGTDTLGRIAYVRQIDSSFLVLQRSFPVHSLMAYSDTPLGQRNTLGDVAQFFNDGGELGRFGEIEHHSPALVYGEGPQTFCESSLTLLGLYPSFACIGGIFALPTD